MSNDKAAMLRTGFYTTQSLGDKGCIRIDFKSLAELHQADDELRAFLTKSTEQHQDEPVALPSCNAKLSDSHDWDQGYRGGWRACLDEISKLGPLYTHADPCDVEWLRLELKNCTQAFHALKAGNESLHAQLAEQAALLDEAYQHDIGTALKRKMRAHHDALSAGAGPTEREAQAILRAPAEIDERAEYVKSCQDHAEMAGFDPSILDFTRSQDDPESYADTHTQAGWSSWKARATLSAGPEAIAPGCTTCNDEGAVGNILDTVPCPDCAAAPPAEHDEQAAFERAFVVQEGVCFSPERKEYRSMNGRNIEETDSIDLNLRLSGWMARAALAGFKPTVLSRCVLCDQLQADLTALDEKLDQTQDLLRYMVYDYRSVVQAGYDKITGLGGDCDSISKMLDDNPNYQKALALLLPDLESRPEERGTPETEPCSGCGTPGWTGACNKCIPY
ncbi:hypothetical protein [Pseudomonas faucium]|uniref:hypothetical protein n=1 Tax=Pseudomonas faucium TaxID=2740518 RepID=UPI0015968CA8|nr:hypothetical protein [Pseudomonas faucium]